MKGFSLIELMICLVLSSLIILSLVLTTAHHRAHQEQQALELQLENALYYAKHHLEQAIRGAGFAGCGNLDHLAVRSQNPATPLSGTEHRINLSFADATPTTLLQNMESPEANLLLSQPVKNKQTFIISDCDSADIFSAPQTNGTLLSHPPFQKAYAKGASLSNWNEVTYEVLRTKRKDKNGEWITALYRKNGEADREEIAEYIVQMNITYADNLNDLTTPSLPQDWRKIKIVWIDLKAAAKLKGQLLEAELAFSVSLRNRIADL
jgi:prepilin-type N-terminal cleavage/methylation domain-containing protein